MPIRYEKLHALMTEKGITFYKLKKDKIIGSATIDKLQKGEGQIDTNTIAKLCLYLQCQPGDIMEYVED